MISIYMSILAGFVGLLAALILARKVISQPAGNNDVTDIGKLIQEGAMAFLKREYMILSIFVVAIFVILTVLIDFNLLGNDKIDQLSSGGRVSMNSY